MYELSKCVVGTSDLVPREEALELLPKVVRQSAMANARSGQSLAAGYVCDVIALRDVVLDGFVIKEKRTTNILRGGDFSGPSLFGPLPETFVALLDGPQGAKHRASCKTNVPRVQPRPAPAAPAPPVASVSGYKRPNPSGARAVDYKRSKPAAPAGRGAPFPRTPAGRGKYGRL